MKWWDDLMDHYRTPEMNTSMMWIFRAFLIALLASVFFTDAEAGPSKDQKQFCVALSSYVFPIVLNRAQGVPEAQAWDTLVKQNKQIAPSLEPSIKNLIVVLYENNIASGIELAALVGEVNDECLLQIQKE